MDTFLVHSNSVPTSEVTNLSPDKTQETNQQTGQSWFPAPLKCFGRNLQIAIDFSSSLTTSFYQGLMYLGKIGVRNFTSNNIEKSVGQTAHERSLGPDLNIEMLDRVGVKKKVSEACDVGISSSKMVPDDDVLIERERFLTPMDEVSSLKKTPPFIKSVMPSQENCHADCKSDTGIDRPPNERFYFGVGPQDVASDERSTAATEAILGDYDQEVVKSSTEL